MTLNCRDAYFKKIGVLVDIPTAGGGSVTKVDFCHERWLEYWMCQAPESPVEMALWFLYGAIAQAEYCGCLPKCADKECGDDGCGGSCGECAGGWGCAAEGTCATCEDLCGEKTYGAAGQSGECDCRVCTSCDGPGMCGEKEEEYLSVLGDPKISGVLQLSVEQYEQLWANIDQLESTAWEEVSSLWDDLHKPSVSYLTEDQLETVWLRHVSVCLYHEVNCTFSWSILGYSESALNALLRFWPWPEKLIPKEAENVMFDDYFGKEYKQAPQGKPGYVFPLVWIANPLKAQSIRQILESSYQLASHFDVVSALLEEWKGVPHTNDYSKSEGHYVNDTPVAANIEWRFEHKAGGCTVTAAMFRGILRAFNIPAINGTLDVILYPHSSLRFPALGNIMIVNPSLWMSDSTYMLPYQNMPGHELLVDKQLVQEWLADFTPSCVRQILDMKRQFLRWFSYKQDPYWGPILDNTLCKEFIASEPVWLKTNRFHDLLSGSLSCGGPFLADPTFLEEFMAVMTYFGHAEDAEEILHGYGFV